MYHQQHRMVILRYMSYFYHFESGFIRLWLLLLVIMYVFYYYVDILFFPFFFVFVLFCFLVLFFWGLPQVKNIFISFLYDVICGILQGLKKIFFFLVFCYPLWYFAFYWIFWLRISWWIYFQSRKKFWLLKSYRCMRYRFNLCMDVFCEVKFKGLY